MIQYIKQQIKLLVNELIVTNNDIKELTKILQISTNTYVNQDIINIIDLLNVRKTDLKIEISNWRLG